MRDSFNRRDFLKLTCAAGAGLGLLSYGAGAVRAAAPSVRRVGANEKLTVAVVGTNSRGLAMFKVKSTTGGDIQVCVTAVIKSGYTYDPDQNRVTCQTLTLP